MPVSGFLTKSSDELFTRQASCCFPVRRHKRGCFCFLFFVRFAALRRRALVSCTGYLFCAQDACFGHPASLYRSQGDFFVHRALVSSTGRLFRAQDACFGPLDELVSVTARLFRSQGACFGHKTLVSSTRRKLVSVTRRLFRSQGACFGHSALVSCTGCLFCAHGALVSCTRRACFGHRALVSCTGPPQSLVLELVRFFPPRIS